VVRQSQSKLRRTKCILAIALQRNCTKEHLHPTDDRVRLPDYSMEFHKVRADTLFVNVELEIDADQELKKHWDKDDGGERPMGGWREHASLVRMPKNITTSG